ncbi:MAG: ATP-binding protein [Cyclobacteriaceae bacterium]
MQQLYSNSLEQRLKSELVKELHDELGNSLAILSSRIKIAKIKLERKDELTPDFFNNAEKVVDSLLRSTKDFIWTVGSLENNPANIYYYLKDVGEELFEGTGIEFLVDFSESNSDNVEIDTSTAYQIILLFKEAFSNIIKHSSASRVELDFLLDQEKMTIQISDNGSGFERKVKGISSSNSFGLKNMKQRANKVHGQLEIDSQPGRGTTIKLFREHQQLNTTPNGDDFVITRQAS